MLFDHTDIDNQFNAPVFHIAETDSTMGDARLLAGSGYPSGTAIFADFQRTGRGRIEGRRWDSAPGENLLCSVLLRTPPPAGFTLRAGLAVARTFDAFLPDESRTAIKWPNDVLVGGKKVAGILCENEGATLYVGAGLNIGQKIFSPGLSRKATSLAILLESGKDGSQVPIPAVRDVLAVYLEQLKRALADCDWQAAVSQKLLYRGENIRFLAGDPGHQKFLDGVIEGIGPAGELLFRLAETRETDANGLLHLFSGEIPYR